MFPLDSIDRLFKGGPLDVFAGTVQLVQRLGQRLSFGWVLCRQEPGAKVRSANAAAGVDARAKDVPGVENARWSLGAGDPLIEPSARVAPLTHHLQALSGDRAVKTTQPRHVADRPHRRQIKPAADVRLGPVDKEPPLSRLSI